MARCPIESASKTLAIRAITTARGKDPPAVAIPGKKANDTAAAGAIMAIDWNSTPGNPTALCRNSAVATAVAVCSFVVAIRYLTKKLQNDRCHFPVGNNPRETQAVQIPPPP